MVLSERPPPTNMGGRKVDRRTTLRQQNVYPDRNGLVSVPHWSDTDKYQGLTYKYTMVGWDPKLRSATTLVPTVIIPIRFAFEIGTPVLVNGFPQVDDIQRSIEMETGPLKR